MLITLLISPEAVEMRTTLSRKLFKMPHVCLCNLRFFLKLYPSQAGEYADAMNRRQFGTDGPQETEL